MRGVGTGFEEMRLRTGAHEEWGLEAGARGRKDQIGVRLRGSKRRGALEMNSSELRRSALQGLSLVLLFGLLLLSSCGRIFWFYFAID